MFSCSEVLGMAIDLQAFLRENNSQEIIKDSNDSEQLISALEAYVYEICQSPVLIDDINKLIVAGEEFKVADSEIKRIVATKPKLNASEFVSTIQEADVLIPYKKKQYVISSGIDARVVTAINQMIQGSSFTSSKLVGRKAEEIIGYGVLAGKDNITKASLRTFLTQHEGAVICRHKKITAALAEVILAKMYKHYRKQTKYDSAALVGSVFGHIFSGGDHTKDNEEFTKTKQKALICSSLILKIFQEAGLKVDHGKGISDKFIWPKEFITSPSFDVIGTYFSDEAKYHE